MMGIHHRVSREAKNHAFFDGNERMAFAAALAFEANGWRVTGPSDELLALVLSVATCRMAPDDLDHVHGSDERIAVRDYLAAIRFYRQLLNAAGP